MRNINLQSGNCVKSSINRKQYSNDRVFLISHLIDFTHVVYFYNSSPSHRVLFREPDVVCYTHAKAMKTGNENGQPTATSQRGSEICLPTWYARRVLSTCPRPLRLLHSASCFPATWGWQPCTPQPCWANLC